MGAPGVDRHERKQNLKLNIFVSVSGWNLVILESNSLELI